VQDIHLSTHLKVKSSILYKPLPLISNKSKGVYMKVIMISKKDLASVNIFENLLVIKEWTKEGEFQGNPLYFFEDFCMATINDKHIFHDDVDLELNQALEQKPECIIYASRHRSESKKRSLTVHPVGNFGEAEIGGRDATLIPSSPSLMTQALRILRKKAKELDFAVSFEATHHGPFLKTPTFFIEIGSEEKAWQDKKAGRVIAETILETHAPDYPMAIESKISFGHIIPTYALTHFTTEMVDKVIKATEGVEKVYFHRTYLKGGQYAKFKEIFSEKGITPVKSSDLETLNKE
jgi:D-aminoacyl-tRNA deacylase